MPHFSDASSNENRWNDLLYGHRSRVDDQTVISSQTNLPPKVLHVTSVPDDCNLSLNYSHEPSTTAAKGISLFSDSCQFTDELVKLVNKHKTFLSELSTPTAGAYAVVKTMGTFTSHDEIIPFQKSFDMLGKIFKRASEVIAFNRQGLSNPPSPEVQLPDASQQSMKVNSEEMNEPITECASADSYLIKYTNDISLSKLLMKTSDIENLIQPVRLEIVEEPKRLWRVRTIHCLANKHCPALAGQSGTQRDYIRFKWSNLRGYDLNNAFVRVQILTYDDQPHPSKVAVSPNTTVKGAKPSKGKVQKKKKKKSQMISKRRTLDSLVIDQKYGFNKDSRMILYPLIGEKRRPQQMNLPVHVFNTYAADQDVIEKGNDQEISNEDQILKLFKLRIQLFTQTPRNTLAQISNPIDTVLIQESKGTKELEVAGYYWVILQPGGKPEVAVALNTDSEKAGFIIHVNGRKLEQHEYRGVKNNTLYIKPPAKIQEHDVDFHLTIAKLSAIETIRQGLNARQNLIQKDLLDQRIMYPDQLTGDDLCMADQD